MSAPISVAISVTVQVTHTSPSSRDEVPPVTTAPIPEPEVCWLRRICCLACRKKPVVQVSLPAPSSAAAYTPAYHVPQSGNDHERPISASEIIERQKKKADWHYTM